MLLTDENGNTVGFSASQPSAQFGGQLLSEQGAEEIDLGALSVRKPVYLDWREQQTPVQQTQQQTAKEPQSQDWSPSRFGATTNTSMLGGGGSVGSTRSVSGSGYIPPTLTGRSTTTSFTPTRALPTLNAPNYLSPTYDIGRVNYLAQQQFAPIQSKLQNALYTGMGKIAATDNPYMQGQARKQLLQGYGGGLSTGAAEASQMGQKLYAPEYQGKVTEAGMNYQGQLSAAEATFNAAMREWAETGKKTVSEEMLYNGQKPSGETTYKSYDEYINSGDWMKPTGIYMPNRAPFGI